MKNLIKLNQFFYLLIGLLFALIMKSFFLFGKIQEQVFDVPDTDVISTIVNTAYAVSDDTNSATEVIKSEQVDYSQNITNNNSAQNTYQNSNQFVSKENVIDNQNYSKSEIELLKELSARRKIIEAKQNALDDKVQILNSTESKIDRKVEELKKLQNDIETLLNKQKQEEDQAVMSLVKIYENMNSKNAARIFDDLDIDILINIISHMKESKVSPILASMNSAKARELSTELLKHRNNRR